MGVQPILHLHMNSIRFEYLYANDELVKRFQVFLRTFVYILMNCILHKDLIYLKD